MKRMNSKFYSTTNKLKKIIKLKHLLNNFCLEVNIYISSFASLIKYLLFNRLSLKCKQKYQQVLHRKSRIKNHKAPSQLSLKSPSEFVNTNKQYAC